LKAHRALPVAVLAILVGASACSNAAPSASTPATAGTGPSSAVNVTLTNAGCVPNPSAVPAGTVTFTVTNQGGDAVSEIELLSGETIVGERENLTPGQTGTFSVQLAAGTYLLKCPGATTDKTPFTVTA
jgi:iron uptake system component EfeO